MSVQSQGERFPFGSGSGTSRTLTFASNCTPGSTIIAMMMIDSADGVSRFTSIDDSANAGSYGVDVDSGFFNFVGGGRAYILRKANTSSSAVAVTAHFSSSQTDGLWAIIEDTRSLTLDASASGGDGTTTIDDILSLTTSASNDLIVRCGIHYPHQAGTDAVDSSYTGIIIDDPGTNGYGYLEYLASAGVAGSKSTTFAGTSATAFCGAMAAYKVPPVGSGAPMLMLKKGRFGFPPVVGRR